MDTVITHSKVDIINALADIHGWQSYLEICTTTTGNYYADIDRSRFNICHRLMYNNPGHFDDSLGIEFHSADLDISACLLQIQAMKQKYDVILIDPWHEYQTSYRDLVAAFNLLKTGGRLVVHDCRPTQLEIASPTYIPGAWCGVTYKAYLDFVTTTPALGYYTIDVDYGCGIIQKLPYFWLSRWKKVMPGILKTKQYKDLVKKWQQIGDDYRTYFNFFNQHAAILLHLKSYAEFLEIEKKVS